MSSDLIDIELIPEHREAVSTLQKMSSEVQVKAIRFALKFAGRPLVAALKGSIGQRSGFLSGLVNQTQVKAGDPVYATGPEGYSAGTVRLSGDETGIVVGPNKQRAKYAWLGTLLETGAKPHVIGTQHGALRIGGNLIGRPIQHPGFTGRKIFAPALRQAEGDIENRFYEGLQRHLSRI